MTVADGPTLRAALARLVAPLALGDELVPGARLVDLSVELGPALVFELADDRVVIEVSARAAGARHVAHSRLLAFAYRGRDHADGARLCAALAAQVGPREQAFVAELAAARAAAADAPRVRTVAIDRLLEPADATPTYYTCSPYVGCLIGCRFCYAQSRLAPTRALVGLPAAPWGSWVDVRVDAPTRLAHELATLPPAPIKFCPIVSDPYHAVEARFGVTRACLEVLAAHGAPPPVLLLTRASLVLRDLEVLARLPRAWLGVSLPTVDDAVRAHFEPRAATVAERLAILTAARAAGLRTFAVVQPMLPGDPLALADALAAHVDSASLDVLRGEEGAAALFDAPAYAHARAEAWQRGQHDALAAALAARHVPVWTGELPPDL